MDFCKLILCKARYYVSLADFLRTLRQETSTKITYEYDRYILGCIDFQYYIRSEILKNILHPRIHFVFTILLHWINII